MSNTYVQPTSFSAMMENRAREVGHRLTVALISLSLFAVTIGEEESIRRKLIWSSGLSGVTLTYVLAFMSLVTIVDVVVNDVMSDRYTIRLVMEGRMYAYMLQAVINVAVAAAILRRGEWTWASSMNLAIACSSVWIAVFDTVRRYVAPRRKKPRT